MYGLEKSNKKLLMWNLNPQICYVFGAVVGAMHSLEDVFMPLQNVKQFSIQSLTPQKNKKNKISFGGIPNSRNVLSLQDVRNRAAKPSAGNTSAMVSWVKWTQILLNLTWLCTKASQTFSGTFSGTLLNLTWLCTKASRNLLRPSPKPSPEPC